MGAMVSLAMNVRADYAGSVSQATYIVFITIMYLGFPFALLLPPPNKVQRTDGRKVVIKKAPSLAHEFKTLKALLKTKPVYIMIPTMIYAQWFISYQWQFNFAYFTVRTRALNSLLFYLAGFLISLIMGQILDMKRIGGRKLRAKVGFWILFISVGTSWILGIVVQTKYWKEKPLLDWSDSGFGLGCVTFLMWGLSDPM